MKFNYKMEPVLYTIIVILCTILFLNLLSTLRNIIRCRVNCWFCNKNFWMKFVDRNSWICPQCEQYNGFTKDGDYNKPITAFTEKGNISPKLFHKTPPKNGLCKMCNINQQLKVAQLANYVPMNEKKYDDEIENYKMQLEKAYKLCSPCKKVVQIKLHKEKENLLGSKLLEKRTPEKRTKRIEKKNETIRKIINNSSMLIAMILMIMVLAECACNMHQNQILATTFTNMKNIFVEFFGRLIIILKTKLISTFPNMEHQILDVTTNTTSLPNVLIHFKKIDHANALTQKALGGFACLIQIVGHIWNINKLTHAIFIDLMWSVFLTTSLIQHQDYIHWSVLKLITMLAVLCIYRSIRVNTSKSSLLANTSRRSHSTSRRTMMMDDDSSIETDDDVSLSKFGLQSFTDSSNETIAHINSSLINGRSFTPRINDGIWTKPKLNSTFCVNSVLSKTPSSVSESVFVKPSFRKYQHLTKDDSDSDLDESISTLCIGSPSKSTKKNNSVFSLRKFTASPNFVVPTPMTRSRPLISPSKLGHGTSWVAGGYWGSDGERQIFNVNGSRSSSQSSGFESQTSSLNQRNIFSQPPSREESVCGESGAGFDRFNNCSIKNYNLPMPQTFGGVGSPVFPQLMYNSHVHIPQPRFANQNGVSQNAFHQHQSFEQNTMFKAPAGSRLIKLPQANTFTSH